DGRRSIYTKVRRNFLSPMMLAFDTPGPAGTVGRRSTSNVPAQALILMNDPLVAELAKRWGAAAATRTDRTVDARLDAMVRAALGRAPTADERSQLRGFLAERPADDSGAWADLAHVLFNLKEFVFIR
ncbi:MAG: DUF1553 domain-containing protein, partial [Planctomycetia bacterium]